MGYKPAQAPFGHTAESGNESAGFSETLKIQYLDPGSIPVGMLAVICTYDPGLIPQAVQRESYGYVYTDVAIVLF